MEKNVVYSIVNKQGLPLALPAVSDRFADKKVGFYTLYENQELFQRNTLGEIRALAKEFNDLPRGCMIHKEETIKKTKTFPLGFLR